MIYMRDQLEILKKNSQQLFVFKDGKDLGYCHLVDDIAKVAYRQGNAGLERIEGVTIDVVDVIPENTRPKVGHKMVGTAPSADDFKRIKRYLIKTFLERAELRFNEQPTRHFIEGDSTELSFAITVDPAALVKVAGRCYVTLQQIVPDTGDKPGE